MLFDSLSGNAHGLLYARMKEHQANARNSGTNTAKLRALSICEGSRLGRVLHIPVIDFGGDRVKIFPHYD